MICKYCSYYIDGSCRRPESRYYRHERSVNSSCDWKQEQHTPVDYKDMFKFESKPERDKNGKICKTCKYYDKSLRRCIRSMKQVNPLGLCGNYIRRAKPKERDIPSESKPANVLPSKDRIRKGERCNRCVWFDQAKRYCKLRERRVDVFSVCDEYKHV